MLRHVPEKLYPVRTAVGTTERFEVTVEVHQGSALSRFLFAMVMDCLTEDVRNKASWTMIFADDVVICAERQEEVEERLKRWRRALEDRGMRISRKKTEYLCVGGREEEDDGELKMQGEVPRVTEFRYLGSTAQADGGSEIEVMKRIAAGWNNWRKVSGVLCDRKALLSVKSKLHKVVVRPEMLYSTETLSVTQRMEKKLEVAEVRMLRFECGNTRLDKVKNEEVRSKLKVGQLGIKMRERRLRWFGHVMRREKRYLGRRVMSMEVGKRKRGRPKRRWKDYIREDLKAAELEEADAQDRRKWKRCVRTGDPT